MSEQTNKAWSGVFTEQTNRNVELFTESISFDKRLYHHDIIASAVHARMLHEIGVLTKEEFASIEDGLISIRREIENGDFVFSLEQEDIHMNIEHALIEKIGDVGRKLHTARSRNDQVATDLRLWMRDAIDQIDKRLLALQRAWVGRCDEEFHVILPAYTHLRRAQPVLAPHYWLAYCEKFQRDRERLADCRKRVNVLSLGTAAVAGTSFPVDRTKTAKYLGFDAIAANSIDVSSDRDFVLEFGFVLSQIAIHLSSWADEWITWSSTEFNFLRLPQSYCTGSSIMPQKVNPDVLELIRGKSARVIGNLQTLLVLMKGLPLAYNRDLQEDKEPIFNSYDIIDASLELAAGLVMETKLNHEQIANGLNLGYLDATSLMEYLIKHGVPQRTAHGIIGKLVRIAIEKEVPLANLPIKTFKDVYEGFDYTVFDVLGSEKAVEAMQSFGSTNPDRVREQIERWKSIVDLE